MNWKRIQINASCAFNRRNRTEAIEKKVEVGAATHKFDLFQQGKLAGGVTSGTWCTSNGKNNTGAQDHATAELLWLDLVRTVKRKVLILTDMQMAKGLLKRFQRAGFRKPVEIWLFDPQSGEISRKGNL
jgi:hypothetical protein